MAKPLKVFPRSAQHLTPNQVQANASLLVKPEEPSIPEWVVERLLRGALKKRKKAHVDPTVQALLHGARLILRVERILRNGPIRHPLAPVEMLLDEFVDLFLKSPLRLRLHSMQAQAILLEAQLEPYKTLNSLSERTRWIANHASTILQVMKAAHGCGPRCPAHTNPPSDEQLQYWATERGVGTLRTKFLAYYHGLHEGRIRQVWGN